MDIDLVRSLASHDNVCGLSLKDIHVHCILRHYFTSCNTMQIY